MNKDFSRVISNQVRFGFGYKFYGDEKLYYAWHGVPNRNDDYITITKISEDEFYKINEEYPKEITADRMTAAIFESKYITNHKVLIEGWNVSICKYKKPNINEIKKKALEILRKNKNNDDITEIPDLFGIDEDGKYYHMVVDYPGKYYKRVLNIDNEEDFIKYILKQVIYEKRRK